MTKRVRKGCLILVVAAVVGFAGYVTFLYHTHPGVYELIHALKDLALYGERR